MRIDILVRYQMKTTYNHFLLASFVHRKKDSEYYHDLKKWLPDVLDQTNPDLIVGIARSAIRLLQIKPVQYCFSLINTITYKC